MFDDQGILIPRMESVPESIRARAQLCDPYINLGRSSRVCLPGDEEDRNVEGVLGDDNRNGRPGTNAPIEVRTISSSEYVSLIAAQTLSAASNAADPDTRFAQYFPETILAPERVVCPERIPNPATVRDRGCVPQSLFAPSVPQK